MFIGGFFANSLDILFASLNPTWAMDSYALDYGLGHILSQAFLQLVLQSIMGSTLVLVGVYLARHRRLQRWNVVPRLASSKLPKLPTVVAYAVLTLVYSFVFASIIAF